MEAQGARRRRKDSNRARAELNGELVELRDQVKRLENALEELKQAQRRVDGASCGGLEGERGRWREAGVWREVAARQIQHRTIAESTNCKLLKLVEEQARRIEQLQNLVLRSAKGYHEAVHIPRVPHSLLRATLNFDEQIFGDLMSRLEESYRDIDRVFLRDIGSCDSHGSASPRGNMHYDGDGNLYFQIFGSKIFPFDVKSTSDSAWKRFSFSVRPNGVTSTFYTTLFSKLFNIRDDVVNELFAIEMRLDKSNALVLPIQVKRLYRERDRVAIVWHTRVNPVEFMGCPLSGAEYQETGYFLIERPPSAPDGFALLRTCYVIKPSIPTRSVPRDSTAFALVEFVFKWMSATIPSNHQILEDMLLHQAATM